MEKLYNVLPGVDWVAGRPTPTSRQILLTDAAAGFDLGLGRIVLASSQPQPPAPTAAVLDTDVVTVQRNGVAHTMTAAELRAFSAQGLVKGDGISANVRITQAAYDALPSKDPNAIYVFV